MQKKFSSYRPLLPAALAMVLTSCGSPKSSSTSGPSNGPVPTSRMTINLSVVATDDGPAVVRANLNDGKVLGDSYRLDGGDFLRACISGLCRVMADNDSITSPDYIARFDYRAGVDYVVSFNRQQASNAPNSRVALPATFHVVTPVNHQPVTDGTTVSVSWSPAGAPARASLSYQADCRSVGGTRSISSGTLSDDANGDGRESVSIDPIIDFARSNGTLTLTSCSIEIRVRHEIQGRIDPAFRNGTAVGAVVRTVTLDYSPR